MKRDTDDDQDPPEGLECGWYLGEDHEPDQGCGRGNEYVGLEALPYILARLP